MPNKLRQVIKGIVDPIGIVGTIRQASVEIALIPEHFYFLMNGRPKASEAILLFGSGRGGTTWLHDILAVVPHTQQIFEPLLPQYNATYKQLAGWQAEEIKFPFCYYLRPEQDEPQWYELLEKILSGKHRNYWTDRRKNTHSPKRFLIKLIRTNLMLGYIWHNFEPQIIFTIRHPCATIESRIRSGWLADPKPILQQVTLMEDYLDDFRDEIAQIQPNSIEAHALWWAVENAVALDQLQSVPHHFMTYETLSLNPSQEAQAALDWLGLPTEVAERIDFTQGSRMSLQETFSTDSDSVQRRLAKWQSQLTPEQIRIILDWTHKLGVSLYTDDPLPQLS